MRKTMFIIALFLCCAAAAQQQERREERLEERREERREQRRRERRARLRRQQPQPLGYTPWVGIVDPSRAIDWSTAGIPGGIPNVTTQCSTLSPSGGDDTTALQNALNACAAGTYLQLAAGTFNVAPSVANGIVIPSGVVLRGMGADQTIIQTDTGGPALVNNFAFTLGITGNPAGTNYNRTMSITSSNAKGDTSITVANNSPAAVTALGVNNLVWIADLNDWEPHCASPSATPTTMRCINTAGDIQLSNPGGASASNMDGPASQKSWGQRAAGQMNLITGISGNTLTLQDPLVDSFRHPLQNWVANSPQDPITGFNQGMAIFPTSQTNNPPHVYAQIAATMSTTSSPSNGYCRTAATPPLWPTDGSATGVTENITVTSPDKACVWADLGVGTDSSPRLMYWVPSTNVGMENLQIYGVNNIQYGTVQSLIHFIGCSFCWVRGIEINRPVNYIIKTEYSYHGQIEQNYFTTSWYHGSGTDSVVDLDAGTSGFVVQNNIFERTPEVAFTDHGGSGNVLSYNYTIGQWGANSLNAATRSLTSHDAFPWFTLQEGNIITGTADDGIHGGNGWGTKFRNWFKGTIKICQPVSTLGLYNQAPTRPPAPTVTTNSPGATSYSYAVEVMVGGAQSVPSTAGTVSGPATLSGSAYNTITPPAIGNVLAWSCPGGTCPALTTPGPNASPDRCLIFRCTTTACSVGTQISPTNVGVPCDGVTAFQDTGQASTGIAMGGTGVGQSFIPGTPTTCTPLGPNERTAGVNAWYAYQGTYGAGSYSQYTTSFSNVGNVFGSEDLMTVSGQQGYPIRRKACAICSPNCTASGPACGTPGPGGGTCAAVTCGANSRTFQWIIDEAYGYGSGTVCTATPCHDTTLAQDTAYYCQNYFNSLQGVETGNCSGSTVLPNSFYLARQPTWWGSAQWPPIGPDVSGAPVGFGHVYNIPAKNCYENVMGGTDSTGAPFLHFNAAACYSAAPPTTTPLGITGHGTITGQGKIT